MSRKFSLGMTLLFVMAVGVAVAQERITAQLDQGALVEQLRFGRSEARHAALHEIRELGRESVEPELREGLIEELERTTALTRRSNFGGPGLSTVESPTYIFELHRVVAALKDSDTIPALARALGVGTVIPQLVDWGEQAAPAVLDVVMDPSNHYTTVDDGLRVLRMMVENQTTNPLSSEALSRIRAAAKQRLTGPQYFTTIWYAIDLAAVLDDPELEQRLELISSYPAEVISLGIDDPRLIEQTQQRAAERLAGVPARPRLEDMRPSIPADDG